MIKAATTAVVGGGDDDEDDDKYNYDDSDNIDQWRP